MHSNIVLNTKVSEIKMPSVNKGTRFTDYFWVSILKDQFTPEKIGLLLDCSPEGITAIIEKDKKEQRKRIRSHRMKHRNSRVISQIKRGSLSQCDKETMDGLCIKGKSIPEISRTVKRPESVVFKYLNPVGLESGISAFKEGT